MLESETWNMTTTPTIHVNRNRDITRDGAYTYRPILNAAVCRRRLSVGRRWATCRVRNEGLQEMIANFFRQTFGGGVVDHVICLGVFANDSAFCGRILHRPLHFLVSSNKCSIFFPPSLPLLSLNLVLSTNNTEKAPIVR